MYRCTLAFAVVSTVLRLCAQTLAQGFADTSLAAVTEALAYVRPSSSMPTAPATSFLPSIGDTAAQQAVFGQGGALSSERS